MILYESREKEHTLNSELYFWENGEEGCLQKALKKKIKLSIKITSEDFSVWCLALENFPFGNQV